MPIRDTVGSPPQDLKAGKVLTPSPSGSALKGWLIRRPTRDRAGRRAAARDRRQKLDGLAPVPGRLFRAGDRFPGAGPRGGIVTFGRLEALAVRAALEFFGKDLPLTPK
jgi:hypothetical protein